jgi:hypothetical protein
MSLAFLNVKIFGGNKPDLREFPTGCRTEPFFLAQLKSHADRFAEALTGEEVQLRWQTRLATNNLRAIYQLGGEAGPRQTGNGPQGRPGPNYAA